MEMIINLNNIVKFQFSSFQAAINLKFINKVSEVNIQNQLYSKSSTLRKNVYN